MKKNTAFEAKLLELLQEMSGRLSIEDIKNINELIVHDEWRLAYKILCTQIYEYDVKINLQYYEKISFLGESLGLQSHIWLPLKELI